MEKMIFHPKSSRTHFGSETHENVKISDQNLVRSVRNKSNAKVTSKLGMQSLANANVLMLTRFGNHFPIFE